MPRVARISSPLKHIRKASGLYQTEMARLLNISMSMLQKLENGPKKMKREIAFRVHLQTGCDLVWASRGHIAASHNTKPYAKRHFIAHRHYLERAMKWD